MPAWALITIAAVSDGVHGGDGLADEVGIARRVDDVEVLALVVEVDDVRLDRVMVLFFDLVEVADAGAVVDAGRPSDGAGDSEHLVGQRALAGVPVAAKDNVADVFDFSDRHFRGFLRSGLLT